jgi:hypothetical protein
MEFIGSEKTPSDKFNSKIEHSLYGIAHRENPGKKTEPASSGTGTGCVWN